MEAYYLGHKGVKGMFAVDAGTTEAIGSVMKKYGLRKKGVKARWLRPEPEHSQVGQCR